MTWARDHFLAFDHVQLAMPAGGEAAARAFYGDMLGMSELVRPDAPARSDIIRFSGGDGASVQIHLCLDHSFSPATTAYPAVMVSGLDELAERLEGAGYVIDWDDEPDRMRRFRCHDPFGNRLVFIGSPEDDY